MSVSCQKKYTMTVNPGVGLFLTASINKFKQGSTITLTATQFPPVAGSIVFTHILTNGAASGDTAPLGTVALVAGVATLVLNTSALPPGATMPAALNSIRATNPFPFLQSNTIVVTTYTVVLTSNSADIRSLLGTGPGPFTYTANVFAGASNPQSGTVVFSDDTGPLGSVSLTAGVAVFSAGIQTPFLRTVTATYSSAPDSGAVSIGMYIAPNLHVDATTIAFANAHGDTLTGVIVWGVGSGWGESFSASNEIAIGWNGPFSGGFNAGLGSVNYSQHTPDTWNPLGVYDNTGGSIPGAPATMTISL